MQKVGVNLTGIPVAADNRAGSVRPNDAKPGEFSAALNALQQQVAGKAAPPSVKAPAALKFSNHAVDRMQARGIRFSPEELGKIESAVGKAAAKGSRDSLLITDSAALIVSVKDNTVVTVMDKAALKENVFTNIDSTVMI